MSLYFILEDVKCRPKICIKFVFLQSTMTRISALVIAHKHTCSQCHRSYSRLYNLRAHEAIDRRRYPYLCKGSAMSGPRKIRSRGSRSHIVSKATGV